MMWGYGVIWGLSGILGLVATYLLASSRQTNTIAELSATVKAVQLFPGAEA